MTHAIGKNIAIFCDGTWQNLNNRYPTNVTRLARAVSPEGLASDGQACAQTIFYDSGVGVGDGVFDDATRILGGAFGKGLDRKIIEAYEFLCLNYLPGDRIFIFGFSRGAYTARSLAGLLRKCWILQRKNIGEVDRAIEIYRNHSKDSVETELFKQNLCYPHKPFLGERRADAIATTRQVNEHDQAAVAYLGVWDTVGHLGVPVGLPFADMVNGKYRFHDLRLSRFVLSARHAVAIDERRSSFTPTLWENVEALNQHATASNLPFKARPYQQIWFPGRHSAVGGGEEDGGVSIAPLLWIAQGAKLAGLRFDEALMDTYKRCRDNAANFAAPSRTVASYLLKITGEDDRDGTKDFDQISKAARARWKKRDDYRPAPLQHFHSQLEALAMPEPQDEEED